VNTFGCVDNVLWEEVTLVNSPCLSLKTWWWTPLVQLGLVFNWWTLYLVGISDKVKAMKGLTSKNAWLIKIEGHM